MRQSRKASSVDSSQMELIPSPLPSPSVSRYDLKKDMESVVISKNRIAPGNITYGGESIEGLSCILEKWSLSNDGECKPKPWSGSSTLEFRECKFDKISSLLSDMDLMANRFGFCFSVSSHRNGDGTYRLFVHTPWIQSAISSIQ